MTDNNIQARVEAGMAWLDENHPGWERKIDLASLNLSHVCNCVLGQTLMDIAGHQESGYSLGSRQIDADGLDPTWLGFDIGALDQGFSDLEAEWRDAIKRRFDTGVLSDDVVRPA